MVTNAHAAQAAKSVNMLAKTLDNNDSIQLYAEPVKRILDRSTREVVGWLYEWNTGSLVPMWKCGRKSDVVYE